MPYYVSLFVLLLAGCSLSPSYVPDSSELDRSSLPIPNANVSIAGLSACIDTDDESIQIDTNSPITVLVHGCNSSSGRFRSLAQLYAFHGQQAVCYNYDDRHSLVGSADKLAAAISELSKINKQKISIIGHSMGGLVSRKALEANKKENHDFNKEIELTTISAPFSGIEAASHCAIEPLHWLTLGIVPGICWLVTGDNWNEITHSSSFINKPKLLTSEVTKYLKIVTNEKNTCRLEGKDGACLESDYVFNLSEQYHDKIDSYPNITGVQVDAGHVEIVGNNRIIPRKLLSILQRYGMLAGTPKEREAEFERLLSKMY